ncbi:PLP-dependent aminotransferase family protein [Neobacillus niacini]|uniref:MocR-like pyridoxine biosynthesis transcription factor PdxR n=1 Tax=Neobacillus niacini TaxID=86668 RepID=UPI00285988BB|nr:PLP-dependent aminotransferase family protein [Neobacillus niacini]MDR7002017.1 GntR family transcriptional regulator/MocR family aminotransferase [Neobacillus niacini]
MLEFTPNLETHRDEPIYIQLYNYIKKEIKTGKLPPNTKLPSKRKLSAYLQVSQNTIEAAYGQLLAEGYIESKPRRGYFVCELEQANFTIKRAVQFVEEKKYKEQFFAYDFTYAGVDAGSFPFGLYRKITNEVLRIENGQVLLLGHPQGDFELRESIAKYLFESRGVHCSPSQIIIGSGTPYLFSLLLKLLHGSKFAVEDPGYHRRHFTHGQNDEDVQMIPLDQGGIILSELEQSGANIVCVTPSHQFPCGMVMPISRRMQLLNWAEKEANRFIIEDDYDSEFRYVGKPIPALQGLDQSEKVIYMSTFSKALLPSLRISYMVLPKPLIKRYQAELFFYAQTVSRIDQEVLKRFMQHGYWEKHIQKVRVVYQKKRDLLISAISSYFPDTVDIIGQDSGLHILIRPNNGLNEQELIDKAAAFSIKVYPVSPYGKNDDRTVLLGFATLTEDEIVEAVQSLAKAWFY